MADQGNGGYMNYGDGESDFKRKADTKKDIRVSDDEEESEMGTKMPNDFYIKDLLSERVQMEGKYPHADRLLQQEVANAKQKGKLPGKDMRYVDIYHEKPIKVVVKVIVPIKEHPKFNFVGKLLGPKGNSLRRLQEDTLCKMAVMGRGSMKDRAREEKFRQSLDPKYAHLNDELHVEISALAPPAEAHARVAYALAEVRKYLIPDSNDEIRQEQFRELVADGVLPPADDEEYYSNRPPPPGPLAQHSAAKRPRSPSRSVVPAKQKVMSILDRARTAMDTHGRFPSSSRHPVDYDYENEYDRAYHELERPPPPRSRSRPVEPAPPPPVAMEYRREYYRDRSSPPPVYVKSDHHHHHHRRSPPPPPLPSSAGSSWRSAGGGSEYASSRHHRHEIPEEGHYPRSHRGYHVPSEHAERSYRGSPYMRHQK